MYCHDIITQFTLTQPLSRQTLRKCLHIKLKQLHAIFALGRCRHRLNASTLRSVSNCN